MLDAQVCMTSIVKRAASCSLFASCQSSEMVGKDMVFAFVFYYLKVELQEGDNQSSIFVGSVGLVDEV